MKKSKLLALLCLSMAIIAAFALGGCSLFDLSQTDDSFPYDGALGGGYTTDTRDEWLASQETPSTIYRKMYEEAVADGSFTGSYYAFLQQLGLKGDDTPYINNALCSVVSIRCGFVGTNTLSAGSGVVWSVDKTEGDMYIITNYHVLYNDSVINPMTNAINVWLYGEEVNERTMAAKFVGGTMEYDIALLLVDGDVVVRETDGGTHTNAEIVQSSSVVAATFGDSDCVTLAERVYAIGNPLGDGISVVSGIVSVTMEYVSIWTADKSKRVEIPEIRTDAPINHGNSGGGLFNSAGELVGIVNARTESDGVVGFGYAIPINFAAALVRNLLDHEGEVITARLGIELTTYDSLGVYNARTGKTYIEEKVVIKLVSSGAGHSAGLKMGDTVMRATLKSASGASITVEITRRQKLVTLLLDVRQGDTLILTVSRDGKIQNIDVSFSSSSNFIKIA